MRAVAFAGLAVVMLAVCQVALAQGEWHRYMGNPVLGPSADGWDSRFVLDPAVIKDGNEYKMYYCAYGVYPIAIGLATSPDGITWTRRNDVNPVLRGTPDGWDGISVDAPSVIKDGAEYKMWYSAGAPLQSIGYATSTNGITWTKHISPVLTPSPGTWDESLVRYAWVISDTSHYKMYYTGAGAQGWKVGLAISLNGIAWSKYVNPVLSLPGDGWQGGGVSVLVKDNVYYMWYSDGVHVYYATSPNGVAWTQQGSGPVLSPGSGNDTCRVTSPSVLYDDAAFHMWYTTGCYGETIGYATTGTPPLPTLTATPTQTRTPTRTPTMTPIPMRDKIARLPIILRNVPSPTPTATASPTPAARWVTIVSEDFEGPFPGPWLVDDGNDALYGEFYWGKRDCRAFAGRYSGWATGAGTTGSGLACGANYPNRASSWMVYGPFSLVYATDAELRFKLWQRVEAGYDGVCALASVDGRSFSGNCYVENTQGCVERRFDLTDVYKYGNLVGQPQVWVALVFTSDGAVVYPEGAYVDDVVLRACMWGTCH